MAVGETETVDLRVAFDRRLKLEFHGSKITSDVGLLAFRELDDALGLTEITGQVLADNRTGRNNRHSLTAQCRQSVFGRLAGYEDVNDADRLGHDPAMRWIVGGRAVAKEAASTSQMGRFETEVLTGKANRAVLADLSGKWIDAVHARRPTNVVVLDMDSSVSPTHGEQEGTAYNGHFGCNCQHPLFVFNQFGYLERCSLRSGNVHSADDWRSVLEPVVARYRDRTRRWFFRGDAAFALPDLYDYLVAEGYKYTIRLKANAVLRGHIAHLLKRPVGRPPKYVLRFYAGFSYQAGSWNRKRRVVAKVEWHPGELYPRVGFIVTNLTRPAARVTAFYNQRGTEEQYIKEGKNAVKWTRLSRRSMKANAVRLQLHALACNLSNFLRTLALPDEMESWSLTTLREKMVKIGAKVIVHARYAVFQMAEVAVPRDLFRRILDLIDDLRPREPAPC
ncbi:MAG: IS1380 family transposase [Alphaproteobacteria bacterium]|nr:IS1380 family transposase [Alphaproteobacteria bacterium]